MKYQVVILAGGDSTRFFPFNKIHKSFFQIAGKTIIERTVESATNADPSEIIVVLGSKNFDEESRICKEINTFKNVRFVPQNKALGQADAILAVEKYITGPFFVLNAQQFNFDSIADDFLDMFNDGSSDVVLGSTETDTPDKYGILAFEGDRVTGIVEKPELGHEPSNKRLVGVYLLKPEIFEELKKTDLSEYCLEQALNNLAIKGKVKAVNLPIEPPTLKYPWNIFSIKDEILSTLKSGIDKSAILEETAILKGNDVVICEGAHICDFAMIESPVYIGKDAVVGTYCQIRGGSVLEEGAQVERYTDVKNSYIGKNTHIHSGFIGDSIIGSDCRVGADFVVANKRLDRTNIKAIVKGERVDTGLTKFGAIIGDGVHMGVRVSTMPGSIIGFGSNIFPGTILKGFIPEKSEIKS